MTPPSASALAGDAETPLVAVTNFKWDTLPGWSLRRLSPIAFLIRIACSGVGRSNRRRHPSSSPSCVTWQNDNRFLTLLGQALGQRVDRDGKATHHGLPRKNF
jgi:hypothetical protein